MRAASSGVDASDRMADVNNHVVAHGGIGHQGNGYFLADAAKVNNGLLVGKQLDKFGGYG